MSKLIIVRGVAGSGKSTLAHKFPYLVLEGDMFRFDENLDYIHDHKANYDIFNTILNIALSTLNKGYNVVCCNTYISNKHMEPLITLAERLDCNIEIITLKTYYGSIHNVPEETIERMKKNFEEVKPEWQKYVVQP